MLYAMSAHFVMKNTSAIKTAEFEEMNVRVDDMEQVEEKLIDEHLGQIKIPGVDVAGERGMVKDLLHLLSSDRKEGERVIDFEARLRDELKGVLW